MDKGFAFKNVYPSELGIHIEHYTEVEAQAAYTDAKNKGMNVRLDGSILTWQFYNPRSPQPIGIGQERTKNPISRGKLRLPQFRKLRGVALGRRLVQQGKAALPLHERK